MLRVYETYITEACPIGARAHLVFLVHREAHAAPGTDPHYPRGYRGVVQVAVVGPWPFATGAGYCAITDTWDENRGERAALSRALVSYPREVRAAIWKAYFHHRPPLEQEPCIQKATLKVDPDFAEVAP